MQPGVGQLLSGTCPNKDWMWQGAEEGKPLFCRILGAQGQLPKDIGLVLSVVGRKRHSGLGLETGRRAPFFVDSSTLNIFARRDSLQLLDAKGRREGLKSGNVLPL